jgi:ABC-type lipoprotein export system ATPase subunit
LDSHQGAAVVDLLRTLADRDRRTVLLATHSREAASAADYVWTMRDGRLIERTAPTLLPLRR